MTQYQMMKKIAKCKAKLRFVESEIRNITEFFALLLYEVRQKLEELELKLEENSENAKQKS